MTSKHFTNNPLNTISKTLKSNGNESDTTEYLRGSNFFAILQGNTLI